MNYGLKPKTQDERDFKLGSVYDLPSLKSLPRKFLLPKVKIKNQRQSDFCAAFASCTISELQEGVELAPEWLFAVAKSIEGGDPDSFGLELRSVCKAHQKHGCIEAKDSPYSLENKPASFLRRIENWPDLYDKAIVHKKGSYFDVKGPYDSFDDIRASIFKFKSGVLIGVVWSWDKSKAYIDEASDEGEGHALAVALGWDGDYLVVQNSWGKDTGKDGYHYIHRNVINKFVGMYGAYMFSDISKEEAEDYIKHGTKADKIKLGLLGTLLGLYETLLDLFQKKSMTENPENKDRLYTMAKRHIGFNLAPGMEVLGCAISLCAVHNRAFPELPPLRFVNTTQWYNWMKKETSLWKQLDAPEPDCIIVSVTGHIPSGSPLQNGHIGIVGRKLDDDGTLYVMSNNSNEGYWDTQFTLKKWKDYYQTYGKIPTYYFRRI